MARSVVWSPLAKEDFHNILYYLDQHWDSHVANQFSELTLNKITKIVQNPKHFALINPAADIRKCVLTKQNTLFYREIGSIIAVLRIFDTRQDPKKLRFD
ncbi:hypothetical protein BCY91_05425 [Pelobium manganitolerans]|uniref:Plasmid stabilization protein n=1 Tax=Pelobium manganitolerans TaxID=1842495 RepID=A0A419S643_9SPHI|nr:hypothetical protein BCY91_05425 [Pelobium manganitolerans]